MKRKNTLALIFFFIGSNYIFSQSNNINSYYLHVKNNIEQKQKIKNEIIDDFMEKNGISKRPAKITDDGRALFFETHNIDSSKDTKTDQLNPSGSLGLNLEGEGYKIGVWDEGHVFKEHVEFQNAVDRVLIGQDLPSDLNYDDHATHVAGTIGASGVNPDAKGMASKVQIISYDWNNAFLELMANAANDIYISNHSYGMPGFDDDGKPTVSYSYLGTYDDWASDLDAIHFARPNFLAVCSAGNEGLEDNFESAVAKHDVLTDISTAKNNMVVANAKNIIYFQSGATLKRINESSSQGPTNDFRVKPDISGIGTEVTSSTISNNLNEMNLYSSASGTSMAAPNISGSLVLLQEFYHKTKGELPLSSTLKALTINTALDAGDDGPDPNFGWGIMDSMKSAITISENVANGTIFEGTISQGEEIIFGLEFYNNESEISVTMCWTDPEGDSLESALDKNVPVLINDLDLRIIENETIEYFPYAFSLENKINNNKWAIKTDNVVDNVERVDFNKNTGASYKIKISHKNNLFNPSQDSEETQYQNFSIVVSNGAKINTTLDINEPYKSDQEYFSINYQKSGISLVNISDVYVDTILIYSLDGRLIYSEKPNQVKKIYNLVTLPKTGILVAKFGESRYVKKFLR
jgi:beta-lactamase class A